MHPTEHNELASDGLTLEAQRLAGLLVRFAVSRERSSTRACPTAARG